MLGIRFFPALAILLAGSGWAESLRWVQEPALTFNETEKKWWVTFELDKLADVEVAIVDPGDSSVVRHLAAGVLGTNPPAPLTANACAQKIPWDGKDDFNQPVASEARLAVRVRVGMSVALRRVIGGDPYAFYSKEMGQGDHAAWRVTGLEVKPGGQVYVMGNANNYGPPAIRQYDAQGNYQRTVYPPPAGKSLEEVRGWGLNVREDGTYTPQYNDLSSPALSNTLISGTRGRIATLIPSPEKDHLVLMQDFKLMRICTDGTIPPRPMLADRLVNEPSLFGSKTKALNVAGPTQISLSPDGKHFYFSGLFAGAFERTGRVGAEKTGDWRDGQVFKVDFASRKATVFFALPEDAVIGDLNARGASPIADFKYGTYAALQGVAADAEGRVFVCDRQNKRVVVLDSGGRITREIPLEYPDAIAVSPKSKALYVTTRTGHFHGRGELKLLKFDDWSRDTAPSATMLLCPVQHYDQATRLAVAEAKGEVYVWVAYTALPVRVYLDKGAGLELVKDFYAAGPQRALDVQHIVVDQKTETLYISDGFNHCFRVSDWNHPKPERCMQDAGTPLRALSLAIDSRNRHLYGHADRQPVARYKLDGDFLTPAPPNGFDDNAFTPRITNDWRIGLGMGDRGIAVGPDGCLATMNALGTGPDYSGSLRFFKAGAAKAHREGLLFECFGEKVAAAGVRFDLRGNLYAGKIDGKPKNPPKGFEEDGNFLGSTGRIYKYAPTGSFESGDLFPREPSAPSKIYDINYGAIGPQFCRTPSFGVDGYGRVYYPTSLLPQVSVIDNEGNIVLKFGTYGNRDSMGGLPGDLVPTSDIPLAYPNSVDVTDRFIYVSDVVNIRVLQIEKIFELSKTSKK